MFEATLELLRPVMRLAIFTMFVAPTALYCQKILPKCQNCDENLRYQGEFLGMKLYGGLFVNRCNACGFDMKEPRPKGIKSLD